MSDSTAHLYEEDFVRWTEQQSRALRKAAHLSTNLPLDWENLAEEIESLGASQRRELRSRLAVILEHLMKLENSPAIDPRRGWRDTILRERTEIERLLEDSPSLRGDLARLIAEEAPRVMRLVTRLLHGYNEHVGVTSAPPYSEDQVLGDWLPGEAPLPASGEREGPA